MNVEASFEFHLKKKFKKKKQSDIKRIQFHKATKASTSFSHGNARLDNHLIPKHANVGRAIEHKSTKEADKTGFEKKIGLPPESHSLCKSELIWALQKWSSVKRIGPGFYNLGNTCFLNSTLQCLAYTPALSQYLLKGLYSKYYQKRAAAGMHQGFNIMVAMEQLNTKVHMGSRQGPISPKVIVSNIRVLGRQFRIGRQEDAHEFLCHILDAMVKAELTKAGIKGKNATRGRLAETTAMHRIFGGYLRNQVKCPSCGYCSETYNQTMDFSLELTGGANSLQQAINHFTAPEKLDQSNRWKCGGCAKSVCATKQLTVFKAPNVAVFQFKRFAFGSYGGKTKRPISYPEKLVLKTSGPEKSVSYDLTGVLVHLGGSMHGGHYYSFVKAANSLWYQMDDSSVRQVGKGLVLQQSAYLLFYVRSSPPKSIQMAQKIATGKENISDNIGKSLDSSNATPIAQKESVSTKSSKKIDKEEEDLGKVEVRPDKLQQANSKQSTASPAKNIRAETTRPLSLKNTASPSANPVSSGAWSAVFTDYSTKQKEEEKMLAAENLNVSTGEDEESLKNPTPLTAFVQNWKRHHLDEEPIEPVAPPAVEAKPKVKISKKRKRRWVYSFTGKWQKLYDLSMKWQFQSVPFFNNTAADRTLKEESKMASLQSTLPTSQASSDGEESTLEEVSDKTEEKGKEVLNSSSKTQSADENEHQQTKIKRPSAKKQRLTNGSHSPANRGKSSRVEVTGKKAQRPFIPEKRGKSAMIYGTAVGNWDDQDLISKTQTLKENQEAILSKHLKEERKLKKERQLDYWDKLLDLGKVKKVKNISHEGKKEEANPFQSMHNRKKKNRRF